MIQIHRPLLNTFRNQRGLTIVELAIVLVISASLAIGGITTYRILFLRTNLRQTTQEMADTISAARLESIAARNSNRYGVHFMSDRYQVFTNSYALSNVVRTHTLPSNIRIVSIELTPTGTQGVIFEKLTGITNNQGKVVVQFRNERQEVVINKQGLVTIE